MNDDENLWPGDFSEPSDLPPVTILRQQGNALGVVTHNIVVGRVDTFADPGGGFDQRFNLYCGPLAVQLPLLRVTHGIELYPAELIYVAENSIPSVTARSSTELKARLREVFARPKTKEIIASLLAQSKE